MCAIAEVHRAENVKLKARLRLIGKNLCEVCWTCSPVPIPPEEADKCYLVHPHAGDHARCEMCWATEQLIAMQERLKILESRLDFWGISIR